jgi:5-methylcytosine-specific restriction endonuclease McrA
MDWSTTVNNSRLADSIELFKHYYRDHRAFYEEDERAWKDKLRERFGPVFARSFAESLSRLFEDSAAVATIVYLCGGAHFQCARFRDLLESEPEPTRLSELFADLLYSRTRIGSRINRFKSAVDALYKELPRDGTIQLNLISQFLGLCFPDRYYIYKYTEFDRAVSYFEYGVEQVDNSAGGKFEYYLGFAQEIKKAMVVQSLNQVDFIDVQTFVNRDDWYTPADPEEEKDRFEEETTGEQSVSVEQLVQRVRETTSTPARVVHSVQYHRDPSVAALVKKDAQGVCDLCGKKAPFENRSGNPYLESHHVVYLSDGGEDRVNNCGALCPNCHAKMHVLNLDVDREKLIAAARSRHERLLGACPPA